VNLPERASDHQYAARKLQRNRERITVRGLNRNHNPDLKNIFKKGANFDPQQLSRQAA